VILAFNTPEDIPEASLPNPIAYQWVGRFWAYFPWLQLIVRWQAENEDEHQDMQDLNSIELAYDDPVQSYLQIPDVSEKQARQTSLSTLSYHEHDEQAQQPKRPKKIRIVPMKKIRPTFGKMPNAIASSPEFIITSSSSIIWMACSRKVPISAASWASRPSSGGVSASAAIASSSAASSPSEASGSSKEISSNKSGINI
jgi:hypothetical protein